jgi:hypothetical protein
MQIPEGYRETGGEQCFKIRPGIIAVNKNSFPTPIVFSPIVFMISP